MAATWPVFDHYVGKRGRGAAMGPITRPPRMTRGPSAATGVLQIRGQGDLGLVQNRLAVADGDAGEVEVEKLL